MSILDFNRKEQFSYWVNLYNAVTIHIILNNYPRIHFVVNCASMGCPDLPYFVLTAENQDEVLSLSTDTFLNHKRGISLESGALKLSSIFDWYAVDFGKNDKELVDF